MWARIKYIAVSTQCAVFTLFLCGCGEPHSDERFVKIERRSKAFRIPINVTPSKATIYIDNKKLADGSTEFEFPYDEIVAIFERRYFDGDGNLQRTQPEERERTVVARPYILRVSQTGYEPALVPLAVSPETGEKAINVKLRPEMGQGARGKNVKCDLTVFARPQYFAKIDSILKKHAIKPDEPKKADGPEPEDNNPGVESHVYRLTIRNIGVFAQLVQELEDLATDPDKYSLIITDAKLEATFNTNVGDIKSKFTISGNVRAKSKVFIIKEKDPRKAEPVPVNDQEYKKTISLSPGQRVVYIVSIYRPPGELSIPVAVYLRQEVTESSGTEMTPDAFEAETGISFSQTDIDQLFARN